jgi:hypothetical protein
MGGYNLWKLVDFKKLDIDGAMRHVKYRDVFNTGHESL